VNTYTEPQLDPNDKYGSCKPPFIQGCEEDELSSTGEDLYTFEELTNTNWPLSDYVLLKLYTEELHRKSCMEDCMCAVAIFRLGDSCWKKILPLSNGRVDIGLNNGKALIKIRKYNNFILPSPRLPIPEPKKNDKDNLIIFDRVGASWWLYFCLCYINWCDLCWLFPHLLM